MTESRRQHSKLILGGPGAGKTRRLLEVMEQEIADGVGASEIAFVSFTKAAVREASERAAEKFGLDRDSFPFCRTLHSLCFLETSVQPKTVMKKKHLVELGQLLSCRFTTLDPSAFHKDIGDRGMFLMSYARTTMTPLREIWERFGEGVTWLWLKWFEEQYRMFKLANSLVDFTDMLERYLHIGSPIPVRVAIVDEAQDLSPLQWAVVRKAFSEAERLYIGADDDQAIHSWCGADIRAFLNLKVDVIENLPKSHRLSPLLLDYSQSVIRKVRDRYDKEFSAATDKDGRVIVHSTVDTLPLSDPGTWYLLARNRYHLRRYEDLLQVIGLPYTTKHGSSVDAAEVDAIRAFEAARAAGKLSGADANLIMKGIKEKARFDDKQEIPFVALNLPDLIWHEALAGIDVKRRAYYLTAMRRGDIITRTPRIHVDTVHSVKGGEADHVAILTDVTARTHKSFRATPDDEWRVWYVGITRTRGDLHIVRPRTIRHYPI